VQLSNLVCFLACTNSICFSANYLFQCIILGSFCCVVYVASNYHIVCVSLLFQCVILGFYVRFLAFRKSICFSANYLFQCVILGCFCCALYVASNYHIVPVR